MVIVDDEPLARAKHGRVVAELDDFRVAAEAGSVDEAVAIVTTTAPDVVYLDIQLGQRSGSDVIDGLHGVASPLIVFTTAYSQHAVRAFEVQALDYLLKPFDRERFLLSIARVRAALSEPDRGDLEERVRRLLGGMPGRSATVKQILVRDADRAFFLPVENIQRVSAAGNYVEVYAGGKVHLIRDSDVSRRRQIRGLSRTYLVAPAPKPTSMSFVWRPVGSVLVARGAMCKPLPTPPNEVVNTSSSRPRVAPPRFMSRLVH